MRNLLALLLFVPSLCLAQLPDYVPVDGLIGWYPLDGNATDLSGNGLHGVLNGVSPDTSRYDQYDGCLYFDGTDHVNLGDSESLNPSALSISSWFRLTDHNPVTGSSTILGRNTNGENTHRYGYYFSVINEDNQSKCSFGFAHDSTGYSGLFLSETPVDFELNEWHHLLISMDDSLNTVRYYFDGVFIGEHGFPAGGAVPLSTPSLIGFYRPNGNHSFHGSIDDLGIWNRPLSYPEVQSLFLAALPIFGCLDSAACNFDSAVTADDGSCEYGCLYCGEGTVWDSTLQECVGVVPPADSILVPIPSCGEGTIWDPVNEECIIAIPADLNYDGCVSVNDLLILLAVHGTCPPYPEWPDETTDTTWTCGDLLTYWDYNYATVLIGDQCWFAENLRTALYANGDSIPSGLTDGEWTSTTAGATSVYGEGSSACDNYSPDIDACDELQSLAEYGRLYNLYAAIETRGLCPTGWKVPEDQDWTSLESYVSDEGFSSATGIALKSSSGWFESGNGSNNFQFSANPGGYRRLPSGNFDLSGKVGLWWSSTLVGTTSWGWYRRLRHDSALLESDEPPLNGSAPNNGHSIRCIKD